MRVVGIMTFGGPEQLQVIEIPEPHAGPGDVRMRVHAATVNPTDGLIRSGAAAAMLADQQPPYIPGMDAAGVVDEIGAGHDGRLKVGDAVIGLALPHTWRKGAYAEHIVLPAASVVHAPANVGMPAASTLLMNALTARLALDALKLRPGETLAVTGSAGAVGGYAIQLAKADALRVIADASPADRALVTSLGADVVVNRGDDLATSIRAVMPSGVAGVIDAALLHERIVPAIADGGGLATVRGWNRPVERGILVHPVFVSSAAMDTARLDRLRAQADDGTLSLRVARVFPASQAAEAHRLFEAGGVRGRLVLDFTTF